MRSYLYTSQVPGAIMYPRKAQPEHGLVNWPRCFVCRRPVDGYALTNETDHAIEITAWCSGIFLDPETGLVVGDSTRLHEPKKGAITIVKGPGWGSTDPRILSQRMADIISRTAFFAPTQEGSAREFRQDLTFESVSKK